jgi:hypothetical protein
MQTNAKSADERTRQPIHMAGSRKVRGLIRVGLAVLLVPHFALLLGAAACWIRISHLGAHVQRVIPFLGHTEYLIEAESHAIELQCPVSALASDPLRCWVRSVDGNAVRCSRLTRENEPTLFPELEHFVAPGREQEVFRQLLDFVADEDLVARSRCSMGLVERSEMLSLPVGTVLLWMPSLMAFEYVMFWRSLML